MSFITIIKPENELEQKIISDPEWIGGAEWGIKREGHPEDKNLDHILDVFRNIDKLDIPAADREKLRLIALIHDTFKHKVDITRERVGDNNHGVIARKFAEKFIEDPVLLMIIETHDEAFRAWRKGNDTGKWEQAEERLKQLLSRLGENTKLYYWFYKCDNETGDKNQECLQWFEAIIKPMEALKI